MLFDSVFGAATSALERGAMKRRRRVQQIFPLEERLANEAEALRQRTRELPPCREREVLLRKARHDETAARLTEWLMSTGPRAPI